MFLLIDIILDEFHFSTLWNGGILLFILFGLIIYFFLLPNDGQASRGKAVLFIASMVILFLAIASPLNVIARIKFSSHVIQLVLLLLVVPPLFIAGFKPKIIKLVREYRLLDKIISISTNPVVAFLLFYSLFYLYHIPVIFNYVRIDLFLNYVYLLILFNAALLLWISILYGKIKRIGLYILTNILAFLPFIIVLMVAKNSLYSVYTDINLFMSALALCLPDWDTIPEDFFVSLLPFDPVVEQIKGGGIFLISQLAVFIGSILYKKKVK